MYSNIKAWIPIIGIAFVNLEILYTPWLKYQATCIIIFSIFIFTKLSEL